MNRFALFLAILVVLVSLTVSTIGALVVPEVIEWAKTHTTESILGAGVAVVSLTVVLIAAMNWLQEPVE